MVCLGLGMEGKLQCDNKINQGQHISFSHKSIRLFGSIRIVSRSKTFICWYFIKWFILSQATLSGMIWYVIPMSVITINDISAYMVGFFCGKTQLIKVRDIQ